jgi:hypothetical protein
MYGLAQIRPLLGKLEEQGVDCVVAGGFAVFLWAERYARTDSRYSALEPFISVDLDLIGDRDEIGLSGFRPPASSFVSRFAHRCEALARRCKIFHVAQSW